jgi:hypothetical protein
LCCEAWRMKPWEQRRRRGHLITARVATASVMSGPPLRSPANNCLIEQSYTKEVVLRCDWIRSMLDQPTV